MAEALFLRTFLILIPGFNLVVSAKWFAWELEAARSAFSHSSGDFFTQVVSIEFAQNNPKIGGKVSSVILTWPVR